MHPNTLTHKHTHRRVETCYVHNRLPSFLTDHPHINRLVCWHSLTERIHQQTGMKPHIQCDHKGITMHHGPTGWCTSEHLQLHGSIQEIKMKYASKNNRRKQETKKQRKTKEVFIKTSFRLHIKKKNRAA